MNTSNKGYKIKGKIEILVVFIILIMLAAIVGFDRISISDFNPINGDFQNYNPVRRMLAGQIPYKDFAVYLGTGQLLLISIIQLIIGNNFTLSLFATNITTVIMCELAIFTISYFILNNKKQAIYTTIIGISIILLTIHNIVSLLNAPISNALEITISPQRSAILIRNIIGVIVAILIYKSLRIIDKQNKTQHKELIKKVLWAVLSGIAILWSNDGGIATYLASSFIYFLLLIKEYKKDVKKIILYTIMYIAISMVALILGIFIITRGNILSWFKFTFGVSAYQGWYYDNGYGKVNFSLKNIDISLNNIIMILMATFYIYKIFKTKNKQDVIKYAVLTIIVLQSIFSTYLYQVVSGRREEQILNLYILIIIFCYLIKYVYKFIKPQIESSILKCLIILISGVIIITNFGNISERTITNELTYIEGLGGYFSTLGKDIEYAINRIGNEKIFSTYATAVEAATGQFQPTGIDYIIHCLGDEQRQKYMETFKQGNFKYVTTTDRDYINYRYWIKNANWFFYKELYKDYKPVFVTKYNVFWEKDKQNENKNEKLNKIKEQTKLTLNKQDDSIYYLAVETQNKEFNGVASVQLGYESKFTTNFFKGFYINRYVTVLDITDMREVKGNANFINYNIKQSAQEYFIPVTIVNGKGELIITSYPNENTELNIKSANIVDIFDTNFKYCALSDSREIEGNTLYIDNNNENKIIMKNAKSIKIGETEEKILGYEEEENYIKIKVEDNAQAFKYPNCFEVIK